MNIAKHGYREIRGKLGFFGWTSRILLLLWQVAMIWWLIDFTLEAADIVEEAAEHSSAAKAGAGFGAGLGWAFILFFWIGGTVILGLFAILTRRSKAIVPVKDD